MKSYDNKMKCLIAGAAILCAAALVLGLAHPATAFMDMLVNTVAGQEPTEPALLTIDTPGGLAVDGDGNVYIADTANNLVRMVNTTTGLANIVAGNGLAGYSGDEGPATEASLDSPIDVTVDSSGNIYIADTWNNRVRKVNPATGIINTAAGTGNDFDSGDGGPALLANVSLPQGIHVDTSDNVFFSTFNDRVRMVNALDGTITTVAGNGTQGYGGDNGLAVSANLNSPAGLSIDPTGNLYIADSFNDAVRLVNAADGYINTIAGTGTPGIGGEDVPAATSFLNSPFDLDVSSDGLALYIADSANNRVRIANTTDGIINTVVGIGTAGFGGDGGPALSALLNSPAGLAYDSNNQCLYISDTLNNRVRVVNSAGDINNFAGNGFAGSLGDLGPATSAVLYEPNGVATDSSGNIYAADTAGHQVRFINRTTGVINTIAGSGLMGYSGDGGQAVSALLNTPAAVALDESRNRLYIADRLNDRIRAVDLSSGTITTYAGTGICNPLAYYGDGGPAASAELCSPSGLALDSSGNLYIADTLNNVIRKVDASTGTIARVAGDGFGLSGYSGDGGPAASARLNTPYGVWKDPGENALYIADTYNSAIRRICFCSGTISTVAGTGSSGYSGDGGQATSAMLNVPESVARTSVGEILIADTENHALRYIDPRTGVINTIAGDGTPGFSGDSASASRLPSSRLIRPRGVTAALRDYIYIADSGNSRVRGLDVHNRIPSAPVLLSPADGATGVSNSVLLTWEVSTDLDGDPITHKLYICTNPDVMDPSCSAPIDIKKPQASGKAQKAMLVLFAGVIAAAGMVRKRRLALIVFIVLVGSILVLSCGNSDESTDSEPRETISVPFIANIPGETYYWKVGGDDGRGGTAESPVWSFTVE